MAQQTVVHPACFPSYSVSSFPLKPGPRPPSWFKRTYRPILPDCLWNLTSVVLLRLESNFIFFYESVSCQFEDELEEPWGGRGKLPPQHQPARVVLSSTELPGSSPSPLPTGAQGRPLGRSTVPSLPLSPALGIVPLSILLNLLPPDSVTACVISRFFS